jgi:hypothetical protein
MSLSVRDSQSPRLGLPGNLINVLKRSRHHVVACNSYMSSRIEEPTEATPCQRALHATLHAIYFRLIHSLVVEHLSLSCSLSTHIKMSGFGH